MEIEKLNEAANEAFDCFYAIEPIMDDTFRYIFSQGAKWAMSQSLEERMTDDEKKSIRELYDWCIECSKKKDETARSLAGGVVLELAIIFGSKIFDD